MKYLAQEAAAADLAIGLKNSLDLIPDVLDVVQFAVNEQCHEYSECAAYKPFTDANKAVFNIEYGGSKCDSPAGVKLTILNKPADQGLNTLGGQCAVSANEESQPAPAAPASSEQAKPSASAAPATSAPAPAASATKTAAPSASATKTGAAAKPTETASQDPEDEDEDEEEEEDRKKKPKKSQGWWKNN